MSPLLLKTPKEEKLLVESNSFEEIFSYILWYGIKSKEAQQSLISSGNNELIELQTFLHPNIWCKEIRNEIFHDEKDDENSLLVIKGWLHSCIMGSRETEIIYGSRIDRWLSYGVKKTFEASEEEQLSWFKNNDLDKVANYDGAFKGAAFNLFLLNAPIKNVVKHLKYRILTSEEEQLYLIRREMKNSENMLLWYYFTKYKAYPKAQELIKSYDSHLWPYVIMQNYGWEHKYEKKWGCLANWQQILAKNLDLVSKVPFEQLSTVLYEIE